MNLRLIFALAVAFFIGPIQPAWPDTAEGLAAIKSGNFEAALSHLQPAAAEGDAEAQMLLGTMYLNGQGVDKDTALAKNWLEKSAAQNYPAAQNNLGIFHEKGLGIEPDFNEAAMWYRLAAQQNYVQSQYNLGGLYFRTHGKAVSFEEAWKWLSIGAEKGYPPAMLRFGALHVAHPGKKADRFVGARKWFLLAGINGMPLAKSNSKKVEKFMSPEQIQESRRLARTWAVNFLARRSNKR